MNGTSLGKDLQNDTEPVEYFQFPESLLSSLFCYGFDILAFKLCLSLELPCVGPNINISHVVDFGLQYFCEVPDLGRFEFLVDEKAVDLGLSDVVGNRIQFSFGEKSSLGDSFGFYQGGVGNGLSFEFVSPLLVQIAI